MEPERLLVGFIGGLNPETLLTRGATPKNSERIGQVILMFSRV